MRMSRKKGWRRGGTEMRNEIEQRKGRKTEGGRKEGDDRSGRKKGREKKE